MNSSLRGKAAAELPRDYHLLYEQTFSKPRTLDDFRMTDPNAWRIAGTNRALELFQQSKYVPTIRSPVNIALIANKQFTDFILETDLLQTSKEYGHRDMCLFFGIQSPTNFYYIHIATQTDSAAHNIFVVNGKPRTKISMRTTAGVDWGKGVWHRIRLERKIADGTIKVYFDDLTEPIMVAADKTFVSGAIGFGSFDDTGMIDNIQIWGPAVEKGRTKFFSRPQLIRVIFQGHQPGRFDASALKQRVVLQ